MNRNGAYSSSELISGRISEVPAEMINELILRPQLEYENQYLLQHYIKIEKVLLLEYKRLSLMNEKEIKAVTLELEQLARKGSIKDDPQKNMSDISFGIESYIKQKLGQLPARWHVDRSRNDFQACAQLMLGREMLCAITNKLVVLIELIHKLSKEYLYLPMPGYTHYQAAQVISPAFYLTAISDQLLSSLYAWLQVARDLNKCPFGAGAMAGLELPWDRKKIAILLGFDTPCDHALVSVASRNWALKIAAEFSNFGVIISRFMSDLIIWSSSEYSMIELPDHLAGISSAMPQKKNYPVLERIRGKTAHLTTYYMDMVLGQRNTPYTNLVETSKESLSNLVFLFRDANMVLDLLHLTLREVRFDEKRLEDLTSKEYFGGFSLANLLSLNDEIPYRAAQVIAGKYILAALSQQRSPKQIDLALLQQIANEYGYTLQGEQSQYTRIFKIEYQLYSKQTEGSVHPDAVMEMLNNQCKQVQEYRQSLLHLQEQIHSSLEEIDEKLNI